MTAPHPLEKAAKDFLDTHQKWVGMTQEEIRVIQTRDFKLTTETLKNKDALSEYYQQQLKFLMEHGEELKDLPSAIKTALRDAQLEFEAIGAELKAELEMTKKVGERFMDFIKRSITRQLQTSQFYGQSGSILNNVAPRSVAVNKKA